MNGVDLIAFTAGIGENDSKIRESILDYFDYLGVKYDKALNDSTHGDEVEIQTADSKVKVVIIPTNEELTIARETLDIVK